jgi:hypothetical protein
MLEAHGAAVVTQALELAAVAAVAAAAMVPADCKF